MPKTLAELFELKVRAGVPGLLIHSYEHEEAIGEIWQVCRQNQWELATFDLDEGAMVYRSQHVNDEGHRESVWFVEQASEATGRRSYATRAGRLLDAAIVVNGLPGLNCDKMFRDAEGEPTEQHVPAVLVMKNHHRWLSTPGLIQLVANRLHEFKRLGCVVALLSPSRDLPLELQKLFEAGHIEHPLPDRQQIRTIITQVASEAHLPESLEALVDAASGLTRMGVEDSVAVSLIEHGRVRHDAIFDLKAEAFRRESAALEIYRGGLNLSQYGGAANLKQYCERLLAVRHENPKYRPKGVFMLGPPGIGKTHFAKCLGNSVQRATALVTLSRVKDKMQGVSGQNLDKLIKTLDAMSPLITLFDEVEGQVSGGKDTGAMDAGTKSEMNSTLLTWLNDRTSDVFVICACNDIRPIMRDMPEFARLGRFDGLFYLPYPGRASKDAIWQIHLQSYGFLPEDLQGDALTAAFQKFRRDQKLPPDDNWTGSEIEACCRLARLLEQPVVEFGRKMPTGYSQATDRMEAIEEWADGRCFSAEYDGIYQRKAHAERMASLPGETRRQVLKGTNRRPPLRPNNN